MDVNSINKIIESGFVPPHIYTYPPRRLFVNSKTYQSVGEVWRQRSDECFECGLYIHIPFWRKKCVFCNLYAFEYNPSDSRLFEEYINAICNQLRFHLTALNCRIRSIQIGGGDPLLLGSRLISRLVKCLDSSNPEWRNSVKEFSIDSTPYSIITLPNSELQQIIQLGVSRVNISAPPYVHGDDGMISRAYSIEWTYQSIQLLKEAPAKHISIDLLTGVQEESTPDWVNSLKNILEYQPDTLAFHPVIIRSDSILGRDQGINYKSGKDYYKLYDAGKNILIEKGYAQQTTLRFSLLPCGNLQEDMHFSMGSILGIGAGARSYNSICDYAIVPEGNGIEGVNHYIESIKAGNLNSIIRYAFPYTEEERLRKHLVLSYNGISIKDIEKLAIGETKEQLLRYLNQLEEHGYLYQKGDKLLYTDSGLKYHDLFSLLFYSDIAKQSDAELWRIINQLI